MKEKVGKCQFSCFVKVSNENNLERVFSLYPNPPHICMSQSILAWRAWWQKVKYQSPKFFVFSFEAGSLVGPELTKWVSLAGHWSPVHLFLPSQWWDTKCVPLYMLFKVGFGDQTNHHVCTANILPIQLFFSVPGGEKFIFTIFPLIQCFLMNC